MSATADTVPRGHTHTLTHTQFEERWRSALHDDALSSSKDPLITWYCNSSTVPNSTSRARFRFECLLCRISFIWFTGYRRREAPWETVQQTTKQCCANAGVLLFLIVPNFFLVAWSWLYHCSKLALYCHSKWPLSGRILFNLQLFLIFKRTGEWSIT